MKSVLWLIAGIGIGFIAADQVNRTPKGKAFFEAVDSRITDFNAAVVDGYKSRDAELRTDGGPTP